MIVVGLDIEATGLDLVQDRPIEVGLTKWTTKYNRSLDSHNFCIQSDGLPVTEEITHITGLVQSMADQGYTPEDAFEEIMYYVDQAQALVAFNGRRFDIQMLQQMAKRLGREFPNKLLIDPSVDTPETNDSPSPGMRSQELITMCAKRKIYYDAHEAGADVAAMLRLMSTAKFEHVLARAQSPSIAVQAHVSFSENQKAKKQKFRWKPAPYKIWWKAVKQIDVPWLSAQINNEFPISEASYTVEELEADD